MESIFDDWPSSPTVCILIDFHEHILLDILSSNEEEFRSKSIIWMKGPLQLTDICIGNIIGSKIIPKYLLERKTFSDLISTLTNESRRDTLNEVLSFSHPYATVGFIFEGFFKDLATLSSDSKGNLFSKSIKHSAFKKSKIHPNSLLAYINKINMTSPVMHTISPLNTLLQIKQMGLKKERSSVDVFVRQFSTFDIDLIGGKASPIKDGIPRFRFAKIPHAKKKGTPIGGVTMLQSELLPCKDCYRIEFIQTIDEDPVIYYSPPVNETVLSPIGCRLQIRNQQIEAIQGPLKCLSKEDNIIPFLLQMNEEYNGPPNYHYESLFIVDNGFFNATPVDSIHGCSSVFFPCTAEDAKIENIFGLYVYHNLHTKPKNHILPDFMDKKNNHIYNLSDQHILIAMYMPSEECAISLIERAKVITTQVVSRCKHLFDGQMDLHNNV